MRPLDSLALPHATPLLPVLLDGHIVGEVESDLVKELAEKLRTLKALGQQKVCQHDVISHDFWVNVT